jgi:hypothetical protein
MQKLMKDLLSELVCYLCLQDFLKLKQLSTGLKAKLEQNQQIMLKREAFRIFSPLLLTNDNPFA